jgi:ABC-type lipoprotein release transport system permease subunit
MRLPVSSLDLRHVLRGLAKAPAFTTVALTTLAIAVAATFIPAWRAARTQPMRVLREE